MAWEDEVCMNIFKSSAALREQIKQLENENQNLIVEQRGNVQEIKALKEKNELLSKQNAEFKRKYENTGLECSACYFVLQNTFKVCPNCGKKIVKQVEKSECSKDSIFQIEDDGNSCLIVGYKGFKDKKIVIPSSIHGRRVIGIWNNVFEKCEYIEEVIFEEGCQYIGNCAFAQCPNLKKVKLPKSLLEIGDAAFCKDIAIEEMIVPINVKKIGSGAFSGCASLSKVVLPDGLEIISQGLFSGTAIREVNIPEKVLIIKCYAFSRTNLSEVVLPEQLRVIGDTAFESCPRLKKVIMHSNLEIIEKDIFKGSRPVIYCAGGSKAQLYARKNNLECEEIQPVAHKDNRRLGVQFINLYKSTRIQVNGRWINEEHYSIDRWISLIGGSKAEGYAYEKDRLSVKNELCMHKYYTYEEALRIQRDLQARGVEVRLFDYWGRSEV